jgi:hypothetical protein
MKLRRPMQWKRSMQKRVLVTLAVLVPLLAGYGVVQAAASAVSLQPGESNSLTCNGTRLAVVRNSANQVTVTCRGSSTTTSTTAPPPATTTSTPPPQPTTTTTSPAPPTTTTTTTQPATSRWSIPTGNVSWQWVLNHPFDTGNPSDLGTDDSLPNGSPAPAPSVYDIDAIINPASTVAALHARGAHVICYVEAGSAGSYYTAAQEGISTSYYDQLKTAGVLGNVLPGYSQENFVNINAPVAVGIIESMIQQQCAAKGFDAVETDLDETFTGYDGSTGFPLTESNEQTFLTTLSSYIHNLGMGWIAKNLVDTGDNFATTMEPLADGLLTENCNQWGQCGQASTYITNGKGVFNAEYNLTTSQFCPADNAAGIDGARIDSSVDGYRQPCR